MRSLGVTLDVPCLYCSQHSGSLGLLVAASLFAGAHFHFQRTLYIIRFRGLSAYLPPASFSACWQSLRVNTYHQFISWTVSRLSRNPLCKQTDRCPAKVLSRPRRDNCRPRNTHTTSCDRAITYYYTTSSQNYKHKILGFLRKFLMGH